MKLNAADLVDFQQIFYWASAVRTDLEGMKSKQSSVPSEKYIANMLRCLGELDAAAERIFLGKNRQLQKSGP